MKRKIYIPFKHYKNIGGPTTFMQNLKEYLKKTNFKYTKSPNKANAIFFPVSFNKKILNNMKEKEGKIIQRLDGVYYPSKHGADYIKLNGEIKSIYNNYADFIIFQSEYSKNQCFKMFGEKNEEQYKVIINGVNKTSFYPSDKKNISEKIKIITTGNFRNIDMIEPIILALDKVKNKLNFELIIIGPINNEKITNYLKRDYIQYLGTQRIIEISDTLRECDLFIYSHLNPPCPNSVLEAVSCGLPVVGFNSGALSELLFFQKDLLAYVSDDILQEYKDFDFNKLADKIELCINNYSHYRQLALNHSHLYSFDECGKKYTDIFNKYLNEVKNKELNFFKSIKKVFIKIISLSINLFFIIIKIGLKNCPTKKLSEKLLQIIDKKISSVNAEEALEFLFKLEQGIYEMQGREAIRYNNGIHTKHKHTKYHDFFIENIPESSKILDIGCGNGALTSNIASKVNDVSVTGIDLSEENINIAKNRFNRNNVEYIHGDILKKLPKNNFDVIILSNVLEHINERVKLLKKIKQKYNPKKILLRLPCFERDWRVPLKNELGIDYRLDKTHFIEYTIEQFITEINEAELQIIHYKIKWGEIWAAVK